MTIDWAQYLPALIIVGQLVLAAVLGGIVGLEREVTHHAAGFRTHILVCVGAALVMITSTFLFDAYEGRTNLDPARLGAQVISGIGFLGAGTILREGITVRGLTTAASLWVVGCIGLAVGSGFYLGAVAATGVTFLTLTLLQSLSARIEKKYGRIVKLELVLCEDPAALGDLTRLLSQHAVSIHRIFFEEDNNNRLTMQLRIPGTLVPEALVAIVERAPFIESIMVNK